MQLLFVSVVKLARWRGARVAAAHKFFPSCNLMVELRLIG